MAYYLAVDIGASGGRHTLGWIENGIFLTQEIHRFENKATYKDGRLVWDLEGLFSHILTGMKKCGEAGKIPVSMGIDTWGVDFVLLDEKDRILGDAIAYRDHRTDGMDTAAEKIVSFETMYERTGIQKMLINSVYQLMAFKNEDISLLQEAKGLLMIPDWFNFLLTGIKRQEYTNATTSALVNAETKTWDLDLIRPLGFPERLFGPLSQPGSTIGTLTVEIVKKVGFNCDVVLSASHDTGSAYLGVPAKDKDAVYLSSGTWSLIGIESETPIISEASRKANFSNEGGYDYMFRVLKNIMGLWMIQSIKTELGDEFSFMDIEKAARRQEGRPSIVDANSKAFLSPADMREAIKTACRDSGQPVPESVGELAQCVYYSLALAYGQAIKEIEDITGRAVTGINIVGGGCKDRYLNELTASLTGLPVYAGPSEATVIGNLLAQMLPAGEMPNIGEARKVVADSFDIEVFLP